jgi:putative transposase
VEAVAPNQVWQMDFTKVCVEGRWYWLLVVMDRFSREIVGWDLTLRGRAQEVKVVLDRAVLERFPKGVREAGLKIASDNGSAFLSETVQEFARHLEVELMRTRIRYPEGNGRCERLIRTIKEEEVWLNIYDSYGEARKRIGAFIEFYNSERIHSALGYVSPRQFVARWQDDRLTNTAA